MTMMITITFMTKRSRPHKIKTRMKYNCPNVPSKPSQPDIPPTIEQLQFALKQAELRKCIESSKSTNNVFTFYYRV